MQLEVRLECGSELHYEIKFKPPKKAQVDPKQKYHSGRLCDPECCNRVSNSRVIVFPVKVLERLIDLGLDVIDGVEFEDGLVRKERRSLRLLEQRMTVDL